MFNGLIDSGKTEREPKPGSVLLSISVHLVLLTGLGAAPLVYYDKIPETELTRPVSDPRLQAGIPLPPLLPSRAAFPDRDVIYDAVCCNVAFCCLGAGLAKPGPESAQTTQEKEPIYHVEGALLGAKLIRAAEPRYPKLPWWAQIKGPVYLRIVVDRSGGVRAAKAIGGPAVLFDAALGAVRQWSYEPTFCSGRPVEVTAIISVDFRER